MVAKNDITGDNISTKVASEQFRNNFDSIFGKRRKNCGDACGVCAEESGVSITDRQILCPYCGTLRCDKASDHELKCTGSYE